jgi:hypothetical protein
MTKMLTKKLVTEETVLDKQPRHALYPSAHPQLHRSSSNNCTQEFKASDKADNDAVVIMLCTTINPASAPRELQMCYSLGRRSPLRALTPLVEYHYELYRCWSYSGWEVADVLG